MSLQEFESVVPTTVESFIERRQSTGGSSPVSRERRQFGDGRDELSAEAKELADAIDSYKLAHRRRFVTFEEMLAVIKSLGYERAAQ